MHFTITYRMRSVFIIALFAMLFTACAVNSTSGASGASTEPTAAATPSPIPTTATPSPTPGVSFQPFAHSDFTLHYPANWQQKQSTSLTKKPVYSFVAADNITGFHVELHAVYFDVDSPIIDFFGAQIDSSMNCAPGDTSLPQTVTVNGTTWNQSDILCTESNGKYEIHMLSSGSNVNDQMYIAYGAYQAVTADEPGFTAVEQEIFEPMLQSFKAN
ncbi:MAG TPA: hypothetical protein VL485_25250 [Ktedonobacteraceae bacterium]|nr:hypothetical protein [Ktedonobacteraceae bacterium]